MAWTITWAGDTHERFEELYREGWEEIVREHSPHETVPANIGEFGVRDVEKKIRLHPFPAAGLPQYCEDKILSCLGIEVRYHIDSEKGEAEIRSVTALQRWMGKLPKGGDEHSPPVRWPGPWPRINCVP
jgi:hypothetical protein